MCQPLNQEGITNFFRKNIAKAKAFRDKINIIIQKVENYLDDEDPITSEALILLANDIMNVRDIAGDF